VPQVAIPQQLKMNHQNESGYMKRGTLILGDI